MQGPRTKSPGPKSYWSDGAKVDPALPKRPSTIKTDTFDVDCFGRGVGTPVREPKDLSADPEAKRADRYTPPPSVRFAPVEQELTDATPGATAPAALARQPSGTLTPDSSVQQPCTIDPSSKVMQRWDSFILCLLIFTAIVTPYEVGFLGEPQFNVLFLVNRLVDLGFIIDMCLQFFLGYMDEVTNFMVYDRKAIATRYLKTWFFTDFISVIPFDAFGYIAKASGEQETASTFEELKILRLWKLKRLVKLVRLIRSARTIKRLQGQLDWSFLTFSLIKFGGMTVVLIHWIACGWATGSNMLSTPETEQHDWLAQLELSGEGVGSQHKYVAAIEFALMAMVVGYGSAVPFGTSERLLALACLFVGGSVYVYMIGAICEAISAMDPASTAFKQMMDLLSLHLREEGCPPDMRIKFRQYFIRSRDMLRDEYYKDVIGKLSPGLQGDLALHSHQGWLWTIPFFKIQDRRERVDFVIAIAPKLQRCTFTRKEVICRVNTPATAMYVVQSGIAGSSGVVKRKGDMFGIDMLMSKGITFKTVIAMTFIECISIERDDLLELLDGENFPETKRLVRRAAFKLVLAHFIRNVGVARRCQMNSKRMSREEIKMYKAKMRERRAQIKREMRRKMDTPTRLEKGMALPPDRLQKLEERLPQGIKFAAPTEQKEILELTTAQLLDNAITRMQDSLQSSFEEQLSSVLATADKRAETIHVTTDTLHQKTEVLAKQMEQLQTELQKNFAAITSKIDGAL